jgi:hypothetical protein
MLYVHADACVPVIVGVPAFSGVPALMTLTFLFKPPPLKNNALNAVQ